MNKCENRGVHRSLGDTCHQCVEELKMERCVLCPALSVPKILREQLTNYRHRDLTRIAMLIGLWGDSGEQILKSTKLY